MQSLLTHLDSSTTWRYATSSSLRYLEALGLPSNIRTCVTTRYSFTPNHIPSKDSLDLEGNLSVHAEDNPSQVIARRDQLAKALNAPIHWISRQVHGTRVADISKKSLEILTEHNDFRTEVMEPSDAQWTNQPQCAISTLTADCLPVFFSDTKGTTIAVAHAGWKGLQQGVLEKTINSIRPHTEYPLIAWLGPCISSTCFQVGKDVYEAFCDHSPEAHNAFLADTQLQGKWYADLPLLAEQRLQRAGLEHIIHSRLCTYTHSDHWFSYRYNAHKGRFASVIWIEP